MIFAILHDRGFGYRVIVIFLPVVIAGLWTMSMRPTLAVRGGAAATTTMMLKPPRSMSPADSCFVAILSAKRQRRFYSLSKSSLSSVTSQSRIDDLTIDGSQGRPNSKDNWKIIDVPLVFVPGMKGSHLAFDDDEAVSVNDDYRASISKSKNKKRVWLTLGNLLNFPPRPDDDPSRDLSLPLTYDYNPPAYFNDENDNAYAVHYPRQHRGRLVPDGIVDHIIELNMGNGDGMTNSTSVDLNFLPFYGHATRMLRELDREYHSRRHDDKLESTESYRDQDDDDDNVDDGTSSDTNRGIFDRVGSFIERTSNWALSNKSNFTATQQQSRHSLKHCRPTAVFSYDWRRPLPELCTQLHEFCEASFPNQPVQIIAHSLGGLMSFAAMREHPEKYAPGAVVVGVPFETGIQYLQDLHKGYFTELDRCRQFTPEKQFTMSSHWAFFPIDKERLEDRFVDVTERCEQGHDVKFEADKSGIGKKSKFQPKVEGDNAWFEFYSPDEWERLDLGVFGPEYDDLLTDTQRRAYKEHMRIQMSAAKQWRQTVLGEGVADHGNFCARTFPPFVACASDAVPTVNQILRRRRKPISFNLSMTRKGRQQTNPWEYDYVNGRSVPGDGRIDFDKAFPPDFVPHKRIILDSAHAKQMCWEESGGSWGQVYDEVVDQVERYVHKLNGEEQFSEATTLHSEIDAASTKSNV